MYVSQTALVCQSNSSNYPTKVMGKKTEVYKLPNRSHALIKKVSPCINKDTFKMKHSFSQH